MSTPKHGNEMIDIELNDLVKKIEMASNQKTLKNGNLKVLKNLVRASEILAAQAGFTVTEKIQQSLGGIKGNS